MLKNKKIGVVIPVYNEELLIEKTLTTIPSYVDKIIVIDDGSKDKTNAIINNLKKKNKKIVIITHKENMGLGQSIIDGYKESLELNIDATAIMDGDAQMDPEDLKNIINPLLTKEAEYVKGYRLLTKGCPRIMPGYRFIGNALLSFLTKFSTGYWNIIDPQCSYNAISKKALNSIEINNIKKRYGYNASVLNMLNIANFKIVAVPVKPIYGEEKSGIKLLTYIPSLSFFLTKLYLKRMVSKYLIRDFHPLIFFYWFSFTNIFLIAFPLLIYMVINFKTVSQTYLIIFAFASMMGIFSLFFGMWMDMEDNRKLNSGINN